MKKQLVSSITISLLVIAACGEDPAARGVEPLTPPGADVGTTGTDATATVIGDDSSLVRNAHP